MAKFWVTTVPCCLHTARARYTRTRLLLRSASLLLVAETTSDCWGSHWFLPSCPLPSLQPLRTLRWPYRGELQLWFLQLRVQHLFSRCLRLSHVPSSAAWRAHNLPLCFVPHVTVWFLHKNPPCCHTDISSRSMTFYLTPLDMFTIKEK